MKLDFGIWRTKEINAKYLTFRAVKDVHRREVRDAGAEDPTAAVGVGAARGEIKISN